MVDTTKPGLMKNSMQHWNGCQCCAIDCETGGLDPCFHEILQICILPLDSNFFPRKDVLPFYINMVPDFPERVEPAALKVNKLNLARLINEGIEKESAKDLLETWILKLGLPMNRGGFNRCKILPLGQNYAFDKSFISQWLGASLYNDWFHYHFRDTMSTALYQNDRAAMHAQSVPFPKVNLAYLCSQLKVPLDRGHDSLADCLATAEVYRRQISQGLME